MSGRRLQDAPERLLPEVFLHQAQATPVDPPGQVDGAVRRMVIAVIEMPQHPGRQAAVIILAQDVPQGMSGSEEEVHQGPPGQVLGLRGIDQELADVRLQHHFQFLLREERFLDHGLQHRQRFGQILAQGVKRQVGIFRRTGQFEPRAVVVQALGYLAG